MICGLGMFTNCLLSLFWNSNIINMARVTWNGNKIIVDASRLDVDELNDLAQKYNAEYLPNINGFAFNRSVKSITDISKLKGIVIDESFDNLLKRVQASRDHKNEEIAKLNLPEKMYPFQKEAVYDMLRNERNILLASDPGCGKTMMSLTYLSKKPDSYPALIVCPASLKVNWQVEVDKWTPGIKTYIINGRDSYKDDFVIYEAKKADVVIINYDILGIDDKEASRREKERIKKAKEEGRKYRKAFIPVKGWAVTFSKDFKFKTIVLDECQYIESSGAIRTRAVIQMSTDTRIKKLFLSGTPFETRVRQFYNACHILAPDLFPSEYNFLWRYCDPRHNGFGWQFDGLSNVEELRELLSHFMIRHKKEDVLSQLPKKQKIPIYFDMDKASRKAYDKMEDELAKEDEGIHQFAYLAKMKEALVQIKLDAVIQFIKDMVEIEDKLIIFATHVKMYEELMKTFGAQCAGITGAVPPMKRQEEVNKFQNDPKIRLFIGQIKAAGTGITLTASHTVIFTEWGQTPAEHLQAEDRMHRIGQESDRCTAYYLVVKDTIDEIPLAQLSNHNADIEAVLNGNMNAEFVDFDSMMIAKVKQRKLLKNKQGVNIEYDS